VQHRIEERAAKARGRAEVARFLARELGERALGGLDLPADATQAEHREGDLVGARVVFHRVAAARDLAQDLGMACRLFRDAEEGRAHAPGFEQIEHPRRDFRVRPVVERERDLAAGDGGLGQARDVAADHRAARPQHEHREHGVIARHRAQRP